MKIFSAILLIFFVSLLQVTVMAHIKIGGISPNLILISLIFLSLSSSRPTAIAAAGLAGVIVDFFSSSTFGIYLLTFVIVAESFNLAKSYLFTKANFFVVLTGIFFGTISYSLLVVLFNKLAMLIKLQSFSIDFKFGLFFLAPRELLYNLITATVIFLFLRLIKRPQNYRLQISTDIQMRLRANKKP